MFKFNQALPRFLTLLAATVTVALLTSCTPFPVPEDDDESHASFAREVIPVLLGRRPYGVDEVEVVADIAELYGRDVAVQMLMKDQAFVDHWADTLLDLLNIQRQQTGGIGVAQDNSCWGEPTRETPNADIAEWVRDHAPGDAGGPTPAWNMSDLLRSAIVLDDLSPLYRANLFTMSMRRGGGGTTAKREELRTHFMQTYLNRDVACLRCHNPTYSASNKLDGGGTVVWRRTWTIPGHPEKALFGNYLDAAAANSRVMQVMRGDIRQPAGVMGTKPWGMSDDCATDTTSIAASNNGAVTHTGFKTAGSSNYPAAGFGSLDGSVNQKVSLWELEASLRQGVLDLQDGYERLPATAPLLPADEQLYCDVTAIFSSNCTGCHSGGSPSASMDLSASDLGPVLVNQGTQGSNSVRANRVVPNSLANSELHRRITSVTRPPRMPPGGSTPPNAQLLSAGDVQTIEDWINAGATTMDSGICATSTIPDVAPDEAFAFLTASNLVDGIWMATMGYRLTIDNGFARNKDQRNALRNLTEYTFLPNDWSLKTVLKKVLASKWMGRRAPTISQADTAYELPMMLDPWVAADLSVTPNPPAHEKANGQGDMVNRYRVNTVLRNIASALAWKQPRRFPGGGYPSPLDQDLGQYISPGQPGFNGINFQSLLAIEDEIGLCQKTGHALNSDDWIDVVVTEINSFNSSNPATPLTIGDTWAILKDRLIQDPTIETELPSALISEPAATTEAQALVALFNQGGGSLTLQSAATELSSADLNSKLREACGVLVKSPEFLLTNITPRGYSDNNMPDPPALTVCMDGESCGYPASCSKWRSVLGSMGKFTACEDRSVRESWGLIAFPIAPDLLFELINHRFEAICPIVACGFVEVPRLNPCLINPDDCEEMGAMPPVDPESSGIIGQRAADLHQPGAMVIKADGAQVTKTQGARYRPLGERQWQMLEPRTILRTGDQIYLPLTASLYIKTKDMHFGVDGLEEKEIEGVKAQLISITGDNAIQVLDKYFTKPGSLSYSAMLKAEQSGAFETKGISTKEWQRIISYAPKPESLYTPSPEEVAKINAQFDDLHQGMEDPHGIPDEPGDNNQQEPPANNDDDNQGPDGQPDSDSEQSDSNKLWLVLLLLALIIGVTLYVRKK